MKKKIMSYFQLLQKPLLLVVFLFLIQYAIAQNPSAEVFYNRGIEFHDANQLERAIDYYDLAIQKDAAHIKSIFNRAIAYYDLGKYRKSLYDLDQLIQLSPSDVEAHEYRGSIHLMNNDYEAAIGDYDIVISKHPTASSYVNRGVAKKQLKQYDEALQDFDMALHNDTDAFEAHTGKGDVYFDLEQYKAALNQYNLAIVINDKDEYTLNNRANVYRKLQEYEKAVSDYDKVIDMKPNSITYTNRGYFEIQKKEFDKALEDCTEASILDYNNADAYNCIGLANFGKGVYWDALVNFDRAIELDYLNADTYHNRAKTYLVLKQFAFALKDLDRAINLNYKTSEIYTDKGMALYGLSQYNDAIPVFKKAIELDPSNREAHNGLDNSYNALNPIEEVSSIPESYDNSVEYEASISSEPLINTATPPSYNFSEKGGKVDIYTKAQNMLEAQRYYDALYFFNQMIRQNSNNHLAWAGRGYARYKLQEFQAAIDDLSRAINIDKNDVESYSLRGQCYAKLGQTDQAIIDYNTSLAQYEEAGISTKNEFSSKGGKNTKIGTIAATNKSSLTRSKLYLHRAILKQYKEQYEAAVQDYDLAIQLDINNTDLYYFRAVAKMEMNDFDGAINDLSFTIYTSATEKAKYFHQRAICYYYVGELEKAVTDFDKVISLDPKHKEAYFNRGNAKKLLKDKSGACMDFSMAGALGLKKVYDKNFSFFCEN